MMVATFFIVYGRWFFVSYVSLYYSFQNGRVMTNVCFLSAVNEKTDVKMVEQTLELEIHGKDLKLLNESIVACFVHFACIERQLGFCLNFYQTQTESACSKANNARK